MPFTKHKKLIFKKRSLPKIVFGPKFSLSFYTPFFSSGALLHNLTRFYFSLPVWLNVIYTPDNGQPQSTKKTLLTMEGHPLSSCERYHCRGQ